ncbi:MAG: STAS domain-containing protein [Deltaproteobacteria bacterium]|nr:STAS domain-containing protein [Deltaproteobacteria bacterium]
MADLKIDTLSIGSSIVLTLKESLTYKNCEELEKLFGSLTGDNKNRIIVDMQAVTFLDSKALELLLSMNDTLSGLGGSLRLFGLNSVCRDTFIATRLINVFHIYSDMQHALRREL